MTGPLSPPTGALVLHDGSILWGRGFGASGRAIGEVCFNTSMTGHQEILTDPSYAGQILTFTFPHIGNTGANPEDIEAKTAAARGLILKTDLSEASSWRATQSFDSWLKAWNLIGLAGIDTRRLTRSIRDQGAPTGVLLHHPVGIREEDVDAAKAEAKAWPGLEGMDLARAVSTRQTYGWTQANWRLGAGYAEQDSPSHHVVAIDYGAKQNILRSLAATGARITVVPATASADEILALQPDGVFLSNGPGDPAATGIYAAPILKQLLAQDLPIFGICLGHQLLALALGARTRKMRLGHRGANHPVKNLETGKVEITSQNHGFMVEEESLPEEAIVTHVSLFDGSNEGFRLKNHPVFSVQYHPEASPGPSDSHYLFERFAALIAARKR